MTILQVIFPLRTCPVCGKKFRAHKNSWAYKIGKVFYCSYHCLLKEEKK